MRPKKALGQHFLHREDIAEQIADALIQTDAYEQVLEIGPGKGVLTKYLIEKPQNLTAVELDRDMVMYLMEHYPMLNVINKNFLKMDLSSTMTKQFGLIGNFPYNISSQILFKMVEHRELIPEMVGMFQKEVAERVVAPEGNKVYGVISVLIQAYYKGEYLFTVDKGAFNPPPKVQSAVIRLTRKPLDQVDFDYSLLKQVVKTSFGQRRKMMRNTLKPFFKGEYEGILKEEFFKQRPERLSVNDFITLTRRIASQQNN